MIYKSKTICLEKHFPVFFFLSLSSCRRYIKEALIISLGVYTEQFYFDSETHILILSSSGPGHSRTAPENSISKLQRTGPGA